MGDGDSGMKRCPQCAEDIKAEAVKCRYCQSVLAEPAAVSVAPKLMQLPPHIPGTPWRTPVSAPGEPTQQHSPADPGEEVSDNDDYNGGYPPPSPPAVQQIPPAVAPKVRIRGLMWLITAAGATVVVSGYCKKQREGKRDAGGTAESRPTEGAAAVPCDASGAQQRADWVTRPSTNWSGDPNVPESSSHDHGLRIAGACNTAIKYRAFTCDPTSVRENVHGFNFFIAQRLGFHTVICDEIDGVDTSKRLVEYPISASYQQGDFTAYLKEIVAEYSEHMCKCSSKACATTVRSAYDQLAELESLLPQDSPSRDDQGKIDASRTRYLKCEKRMLGSVRPSRTPTKPKAVPTTAAAPSKPDPDVDCRQAANKFIAKMKKCDLNMDGLDTSTFCPGKPGSATPEMMRSMADDSCEVILQRISAAMDSK